MAIRFGSDGRLQSVKDGSSNNNISSSPLGKAIAKKSSSSRSSSGSSKVSSAQLSASIAKNKAIAIQQQQAAMKQAAIILKEKQILASNKRNAAISIKKSREQRIQEAMQKQRNLGLLASRISAERIVDARIKSENKNRVFIGEVQPVKRETGLIKSKLQELNELRKIKSTSSIRNKQRNLINELSLLGLTVGATVVGGVGAIIALPKTLVNVAMNPAQLKGVPMAIKTSGEEFAQLIRISPTEAFGKILGEIVFLKGSGSTYKVVGKVGGSAANKLNPFLKRVRNNKIKIKTMQGRTTLQVGVIGKGTPLSKQVRLAGKKVDVAVSAQADRLVNLMNNFKGKSKLVRKPIPGEATLTKKTKNLLKGFDDGVLSEKNIKVLNQRVLDETGKTLLERSTFLDPAGKVRFTRLGKDAPDAKLIDILSGDFTFRTPKPQILVFTDAKIQKLPSYLDDVAKALKSGKKLTATQRARLVRWQIKPSGKFKPIGDVKYKGGKELEITIAPGELIRRRKKLGTALIDGKRVEIIQAEIFKPTGKLKTAIAKAKKGLLTKKQQSTLQKAIQKKTGIRTSSIRRSPVGKAKLRISVRVPRVKAVGSNRLTDERTTGKRTTKRKTTKRKQVKRTPTKRTPTKRTPTKRKTTKRKPTKRTTTKRTTTKRTPTRRSPRSPPKKVSKPTPVPKLPEKFTRKKLSKSQPTYYVITKKRGKMVKLNPKPLTKRDARDFLAYSIDNNLTKSAWFIPLGKAKSVVRPPKKIQGYYSKVNKKLRPYKIRYGKKKQMIDGYIEKRKYFQDTKGEVTQAKRLRAKSRKRKQVKRRTPVKRKPFKRKTVVRRTPKRKASTKKRVVKRKVVRKVVKRRRNIKRKRR